MDTKGKKAKLEARVKKWQSKFEDPQAEIAALHAILNVTIGTPGMLAGASKTGQTEVVEALLAFGADKNDNKMNGRGDLLGNSALSLASENGHVGVVQALLAAGADPDHFHDRDIIGGRLEWDPHPFTPLLYASKGGYTEVVRALLAGGADTKDPGNNYCWESNHLEIARDLATEAGTIALLDDAIDGVQVCSQCQARSADEVDRHGETRVDDGAVIGSCWQHRDDCVAFPAQNRANAQNRVNILCHECCDCGGGIPTLLFVGVDKILEQVHDDTPLGWAAAATMDDLLASLLMRITETAERTLASGAAQVTAAVAQAAVAAGGTGSSSSDGDGDDDDAAVRSMLSAVRLVLPGELAKRAVSKCMKAVTKLKAASPTEVIKLTVADLCAELASRGLDTEGQKAELVARLETCAATETTWTNGSRGVEYVGLPITRAPEYATLQMERAAPLRIRAGLDFSPSTVGELVARLSGEAVGDGVACCMAAILEFISLEVLEFVQSARFELYRNSGDTIEPPDLRAAIEYDEDLTKLFPGGGTGAGITTGAASRLRELCGAGAVPAAEAVAAGAAPGGADGTDADGAAQVTAAVAQPAVAAGGADSSSGSSSSDDDCDDSDGDSNQYSGEAGALASKPYSELQAMAKARGISANTKKELMVEALTQAAAANPPRVYAAKKKPAHMRHPKKKSTTKK